MYHPFIVGKNVYLRAVEKTDLSGPFFQWANDSEVTQYMFMGTVPNHIESLEEEYEKSRKNPNEVMLLIVDKKSNKPIGSTGLYLIHWISRMAEYRIFIGDKEYWDKGIGSEVAELMLAYGFEKLNLNKVWLGVNASNARAVKSYENAGFVREGVLRKEIYRNSEYYDAIRMSVLREEYYSMIKKKRSPE